MSVKSVFNRLLGVKISNWLYRNFFAIGKYHKQIWQEYDSDRDKFFFQCMRFLDFNQIKGDYLEFGCYTGVTFMLAHRHSRLSGLNMHLYAFDSFQGLPEPKGIDSHSQWKEGMCLQGIEEFKKVIYHAGIKDEEFTLVPGFYSESLTKSTLDKLKIEKAALVYVDCDLYESTVPVLNFVLPLLQTGTIIAIDDFYCFNADPDRGEQRALREFLEKNPEIELVEFLKIGWHGKSFIVKIRK